MKAAVIEDRVQIRSLDIASCARVGLVLYALIGLFAGGIMTLFSFVAPLSGISGSNPDVQFMGIMTGVGAIVILPILYGVMGAISGALGAVCYNLAAHWAGGIHATVAPPISAVQPHHATPE